MEDQTLIEAAQIIATGLSDAAEHIATALGGIELAIKDHTKEVK